MKGSTALALALACSCLKLLLLPSYYSTDFDVHRNWMAITQLPLAEWYFEATSEWTLDYPPFFAYFEWLLAPLALLCDPDMLQISARPYTSEAAVLFMRGSVIASDMLLLYAAWAYLSARAQGGAGRKEGRDKGREGAEETEEEGTEGTEGTEETEETEEQWQVSTFLLLSCNASLLLLDHVHFQYNGLLMGLLIACLACAAEAERRAAKGLSTAPYLLLLAALYSVLVLAKHLFVTLAPVVAAYLLRHHCMRGGLIPISTIERGGLIPISSHGFSPTRLVQLVAVAFTALGCAFGPFLLVEQSQIPQILSRLFPFGRGLVHAYWAPNVWALYCAADKLLVLVAGAALRLGAWEGEVLALLYRVAGRGGDGDQGVSSTAGVVGDFHFGALPRVSPAACMGLLLLSLLPALHAILRRPGGGGGGVSGSVSGGAGGSSAVLLVRCLVYASLSSFMLGYHVHEKAVAVPLLLQTLLCLDDGMAPQDGGRVGRGDGGRGDGGRGDSSSGVGGKDRDEVGDGGRDGSSVARRTRSKRDSSLNSGIGVGMGADGGEGTAGGPSSASASPSSAPASAPASASTSARLLARATLVLLAVVGTYSLFPLFFTLPELVTKSTVFLAYLCAVHTLVVQAPLSDRGGRGGRLLRWLFWLSCAAVGVLFVASEVALPLLAPQLPFLPRLLTSVVCAVLLLPAWLLSLLQATR